MSAEGYDAGSIFVQVTPSFRDTQRLIGKASKEFGDELEKELSEGMERGAESGAKKAGKKLQDTLANEVGKDAGKAGEKAATEYVGEFRSKLTSALKSMEKELAPVEIRTASTKTLAEIEDLKKRLRDLSDTKITPGMDTSGIRRDMAAARTMLEALGKNLEIEVQGDFKAAIRGAKAFEKYVDALNPTVDVTVDTKPAERQMGRLETQIKNGLKNAMSAIGDQGGVELLKLRKRMEELKDADFGIDISAAGAMRELEDIQLEMAKINAFDPTVDIRVDSGHALRELHKVNREVDDLDRKTTARPKGPGLIAKLLGGDGSGGAGLEAANAFRTFNGVLLATAALGPGLVPIFAAIAGGAAALAPAALAGAAGIGVLALALSGIGDAVSALNDAQDSAAKDSVASARTMRNAAQSVEDAERSLARATRDAGQARADAAQNVADARRAATQAGIDAEEAVAEAAEDAARRNEDAQRRVQNAREQSARAIESALKRQGDAEKRLADAQRDAREAQVALAEARKAAQADLDDIADRSRQNALDIRQAQIDLFNATVANNATQADPGATNLEKEQASINLGNARERIGELRELQKELADDKKKAVTGGIVDTEKVRTAEERLADALEAQKEAQEDVREAARQTARTQLDGTQKVNDALRDQRDIAAEGRDRMAEAVESQARAAEDGAARIAAAIETQRRTEVSSRESVEDAQRNLERAQQGYRDALYDTGVQGTEAMQKVRDAMGALGPEGQAFALFIHGLRDEFRALREEAAAGFLPGLQSGMQKLITEYGPGFTKFVGNMAEVMGGLAESFADSLTGEAWSEFFALFDDASLQLMENYGEALINWLEAGASWMTVLLPFALQLSEALLGMSQRAADFMKSEKGQKVWTDFFSYVARIAPAVKEFFGALLGAVVNIARALAPMGEQVLKVVTSLLAWIAGMDPDTLGLIAGGILALALAFQAAAAGTFLLYSAFVFVTSPLQLIIGLVVLALFALYMLYTRSETAKKIMDAAFKAIGDVITWLWENVTKPYLEAMGELFVWLGEVLLDVWERYLAPAIKAVGDALGWLWEKIAKPVFEAIATAWGVLYEAFAWTWNNLLWPIIKVVAKILWELWELGAKVAFEAIAAGFKALALIFKTVYDNNIKPLFDTFMDLIGDDVVKAFASAVGFIKKHWDTIVDIAKAPIDFVVNTVLNKGLIGGFNKLAQVFGMDEVTPIPWPPPGWSGKATGNAQTGGGRAPGFANGGIYPGYTPGRDIGYIGISGGEAIMRPEWTRAVKKLDPNYIDEANRRARQGGVGGVMKFLGGFKNGGEAKGGGSAMGLYDRTRWRGKTMDYYTIQMLEAAEKLTGQTVKLTQGSYSNSVAASGSTHAGGGAFDLGWPGAALGRALVAGLRHVGTASWHRDPSQGPWNDHIHGLAIGNPRLSPAAARQVRDYLNGGDGLGGKDDGPDVVKDKSLLQKLIGQVGDVAGWAKDAIGNPLDFLKSQITGPIKELGDKFGNSKLVELLTKMPEKLIEGAVTFVKGVNPFGGDGGGSTPATGDLQKMAQEMAAGRGWTGGQWDALNWIVSKESSWNPRADNPTSSAYGLFQFLKGTWPGGKQSDDPRTQIKLGLDYISQRYGSPAEAMAFHKNHGWYADGGVVPDSPVSLYDNGGVVPAGLSGIMNLTGGDEHGAVFTTDQWERLKDLGNGSGGDITIDIDMNGTGATAGDVADEVLFAARRIRRGGAYAGGV